MVISARNPVHSVLFLILTFVNARAVPAAGAEFLAMILLVVYVGAVAVLFLFVVMMLDVDFAELRQGALQYAPIGGAGRADPRGSNSCSSSGGYTLAPELAGEIAADPAARGALQHAPARRRALHRLPLLLPDRPAWCCWWR
jgi:NADH-quinone oxidoreductase subunit J